MKWVALAIALVLIIDGLAYSLLHPWFAVVPAAAAAGTTAYHGCSRL